MKQLLNNAYIRFWVPFMGRLVSKMIPLIEGKPPEKKPTYDLDSDKNK